MIKETVKMSLAIGYAAYLKIMKVNCRKVVLYYHDIKKEHALGFRKQMKYLADTYKVVKPSEIKSTDPDNHEHLVAITIDDAFKNVYENALPILKDFDLPAAVFAPAGNLGSRPLWHIPEGCQTKQYQIMTDQQVLDVDRQGFEVFSHSYSHPMLTEIDGDELINEIVGSKQHLEQLLGHEVTAISYPHGDHDEKVRDAVKQAGYTLGFTISPAMVNENTDPMKIGRFKVMPDESFVKFKLKCSGAFHAMAAIYSLKAAAKKKFNL
ncbi:MAG: polysaccharide deacetylase family protein [Planctomycetes bacterium]|nr:polysaccharide deacetylase family protein [Planctomycetota bacterium]